MTIHIANIINIVTSKKIKLRVVYLQFLKTSLPISSFLKSYINIQVALDAPGSLNL